jgi:uncharacterized membrane protein
LVGDGVVGAVVDDGEVAAVVGAIVGVVVVV